MRVRCIALYIDFLLYNPLYTPLQTYTAWRASRLYTAVGRANCRSTVGPSSLWAAPSCRSMVPCPPPGRRRRSRAAHKELAATWIARACANARCDQMQSQASRRCVAFSTRRSRPFRPASSSSCVQTLASLRPWLPSIRSAHRVDLARPSSLIGL